MTGEIEEKTVDENGSIQFEIKNPADSKLYEYKIK